MIGLPNLEVSNYIFDLTEQNNKLELHTDIFDKFSFAELKVEFQEILSISDITPKHLQHEVNGSTYYPSL